MKLVRSVLVHGCMFGSLDISLLGDIYLLRMVEKDKVRLHSIV